MKRFVILIVALLVATYVGKAQEVEFTADRPGAATGPATVARGVVQWEQGVQYDGDGGRGEFTFSNTLLRYGLLDGWELRLGGDALIYHDNTVWRTAFTGLTLGTKIGCYEGRGAIPAVSFMANLALPRTGHKGYVVEHLAPSLYMLFDNPVTDWFSVGYNVGVEWDGASALPITFLALGLNFSPAEGVGCFVESHNYLQRGTSLYCADFGVSYMVCRRVQIDLAANINLCSPSKMWAVSFGVAWQINR